MTDVEKTTRSRWLLPALVLLAMLTPSFAFFFSRRDAAQEFERVSAELDATRADLGIEQARNACLLDLQTDYFDADSKWSIAFSDLVIGVALGGDIPLLVGDLDTATTNKQTAFDAYDQQVGC